MTKDEVNENICEKTGVDSNNISEGLKKRTFIAVVKCFIKI